MEDRYLALSARVITRCDREHAADAVLRAELQAAKALSREGSRVVAQAVFSFFRWFGWLEGNASLATRIAAALRYSEQFREHAASFADLELLAKAVPCWVGRCMVVSPEWARALQGEPVRWLRARPAQGQALARALGDCVACAGPLSDTLEYRGGADLYRTPQFQAGEFELQDLSSQAVGWLCDPQPGEAWWDACAGEGGKLLHLSDLLRNRGLIWASDRAAWRLQKLKRRATRARVFNYRIAPWDGGAKRPTRTRFDGVLVDAPCSGLGTWQRNPHARWTTTPEDVAELSAVQTDLLAHAGPAVKPGGKLVYAVCTLTHAETTDVADTFERQHPEFSPLPLSNPLAPGAGAASRVWFWPQDHRGNGMFVAAWRRG
jgi:16S rRNA (cytosine967-C5)-methyltransferase